MTREQTRKLQNYTALSLSGLAALFGLFFWLVFILGESWSTASAALKWDLFFKDGVPAGHDGRGSGTPSSAS